MRITRLILCLCACTASAKSWEDLVESYPPSSPRSDNKTYFIVELHEDFKIAELLSQQQGRYGSWQLEQPLPNLRNHYLLSEPSSSTGEGSISSDHATSEALFLIKRDSFSPVIKNMYDNPVKRLHKRAPVDAVPASVKKVEQDLKISDPLFEQQWHLINWRYPGHDLNITEVWYNNITGKGVAVAVVDDGIDMDHDDLKDNYFAEGSWDFNDHGPDPKPKLSDDRHGTRCCGEIAAAKNEACGVGVAYEASIAGIRILSKEISEAEEAIALNHKMDKNAIYSCSWGPPDDGKSMAAPGMVVKKAILNGVQNGRDKKGSVFVFASGNGAAAGDNCNFDGYTNSIYSITVAAIDIAGKHPFYSESCSANMVVTYSSNFEDHIVTTDVGGCTSSHGGTSAAAPIAAGVYALVLQVNPELTWRDIQYLTVETAVPVNEDDPDWQDTCIGKRYSHTYGYGKLDTYAIVEAAKAWNLVKPQVWYFPATVLVNSSIEYGTTGSQSSLIITESQIKKHNIARLEHINVIVNISHTRRGSITIVLTSPSGVKSVLAVPRDHDKDVNGFISWSFMSVAHWGESGVGEWVLQVFNDKDEDGTGTFIDWSMRFWGEAEEASKTEEFSLDKDYLEKEHKVEHDEGDNKEKAPGTVSTSVRMPTQAMSTILPTTTSVASPIQTNPVPAKPTSTASSGSRLGSLIPTFGLSKHTLTWLYGALLLIIIFAGGVGIYICISRRREHKRRFKRENNMPSYEFDLIPSPDHNDFSDTDSLVLHDTGVILGSDEDEDYDEFDEDENSRLNKTAGDDTNEEREESFDGAESLFSLSSEKSVPADQSGDLQKDSDSSNP